MSRRWVSLLAAALFVLLVASNACWWFALADRGVTQTYQRQARDDRRAIVRQALATIPAVSIHLDKDELLRLARAAAPGEQSFRKEGFTWLGELGFRFDGDGRLLQVVPAVSYGPEPDHGSPPP